jgi:hypothetical protein
LGQCNAAAAAAMAAAGAAAGAGWQLPGWVPAAALATSAAAAAATACWLALCWLAAWRRRRTRVAGPPDPPKGSRKPKPIELANPRVKKGGHAEGRAGRPQPGRPPPAPVQRAGWGGGDAGGSGNEPLGWGWA